MFSLHLCNKKYPSSKKIDKPTRPKNNKKEKREKGKKLKKKDN